MSEATPEQKKMIERALKDTLDEIEDAAKSKFRSGTVRATVPTETREHWRSRYAPMFKRAVVEKNRPWDDDRKRVLERAQQVGRLAADLATMRAMLFAWKEGELEKGGQHVHISEAAEPRITPNHAELAARCIDCLQPEDRDAEDGIRWDWCTSSLAPPMPGVAGKEPPTIRQLIEALVKDIELAQ